LPKIDDISTVGEPPLTKIIFFGNSLIHTKKLKRIFRHAEQERVAFDGKRALNSRLQSAAGTWNVLMVNPFHPSVFGQVHNSLPERFILEGKKQHPHSISNNHITRRDIFFVFFKNFCKH